MCYHNNNNNNNNVCLFIQVRTEVEEKYGVCFKMYLPVVYRSQIVKGENYLVKVNYCFCSFVFVWILSS